MMLIWHTVFDGTLQSLTGSLQGRITYREIPVVITGNRYAEYMTFVCFGYIISLFYQHSKCCFNPCNVYRELPSHITGFEGLLWYPVIFTGSLQGRIDLQGNPCSHYRERVYSAAIDALLTHKFVKFYLVNNLVPE